VGWIILAEDGPPGRRAWRLHPERSMGTVAVVMLEVDPKELLQMPAPRRSWDHMDPPPNDDVHWSAVVPDVRSISLGRLTRGSVMANQIRCSYESNWFDSAEFRYTADLSLLATAAGLREKRCAGEGIIGWCYGVQATREHREQQRW
jgi:hypothetical protein